MTTGDIQAWIAVVGGLVTASLGILKYFNYHSRRDRITAVGDAFAETVNGLASTEEVNRLAAAILLRRFFDEETEQGNPRAPYKNEALAVIAALLRTVETGQFQKLLADGLAYAPTLADADLQQCNFSGAYLGERPGRPMDLSGADLYKCDLTGASLRNARAKKTVFYSATLRGTVFSGADLAEADFRDTDLADASFAGATITGAKFDTARNVPAEVSTLLNEDGVASVAGDGSVVVPSS